jgi:hypothetical protein
VSEMGCAAQFTARDPLTEEGLPFKAILIGARANVGDLWGRHKQEESQFSLRSLLSKIMRRGRRGTLA